MQRKVAFAILATLTVAACSDDGPTDVPAPPSFDQAQDGDIIPGRHIVVLRDDLDDVERHARELVLAHRGSLRHVYTAALKGFSADIADEEISALRTDPRVRFVEPDRVVRINDTQNNPVNWGLDRIDQRNLPLDASYTYPNDGSGVTLYGIDTGILYSHVDFGGRASGGFDAITPGGGAVDCDGHGTHTASTAAGTTYGVAKGATIIGVRVLNCFGSGTFGQVIAGVDWVTADHQAGVPAVANMSLGGGASTSLDMAVANSIADGVVYSLSAGNDNFDACFFSPGRTPSAITVGATASNDVRASFSNYGTCVDIFGPGVGIIAAYIGSNTASASLSGTSMSAPHVAGVALLHLAANPGDTPAQVASAIISNATAGVVGNPGPGSPNLMLYMGYIGGDPPPPPDNDPPIADFDWSCDAGTLTCDFDGTPSSDPDGSVVLYEWLRPNGSPWATGPMVSRTFGGAGTGNITLRVTDNNGATATITQPIVIEDEPPPPPPPGNDPPDANFTWACDGGTLTCTFDATSSSDPDGTVVLYEWLAPNGTWATGPIVSRTFRGSGSGNITLRVTDDDGATNTETQTITIP